jgi:hypothetical protein
MSRTKLPLSQERIAPFDLEAFVNAAATLNQRTLEAFITLFPKGPDGWLSHYPFQARPIEFTAEGEVEGGLSWLIGATLDLRFTRALFAPYDSKEGGHCYAPARSFFLEVASRVDRYPDYAHCCADLRQQDKGRRHREIAGRHQAMPGQDDLSHFRRRYAARTASERTNSYDQEVIDNGHPPKVRGLNAFRFARAIRTVAHLLRLALQFRAGRPPRAEQWPATPAPRW